MEKTSNPPSTDEPMDVLLSKLEAAMDEDFKTDLVEVDYAPDDDLTPFPDDVPVKRFLNLVIRESIQSKATDIYFELQGQDPKIRYKVNGELYEMSPSPRRLFQPLVDEARCLFGLSEKVKKPFLKRTLLQKIIGDSEEQYPNFEAVPKGQFSQDYVAAKEINVAGRNINLNLSRLQTEGHENCHIEIFDNKIMREKLDPGIEELVRSMKSGLILLSSPQDNGKTTTAYQILNYLNRPNHVVLSVEQKAAFALEGVSKVRVNPRSEDYAQVLASVRAYNPAVLFFDDLSDERTAKEVLNYAREGKLILAAVTAKNALRSLQYLSSIDREKLANLAPAIISQRLIPRIHKDCNGKGCKKCSEIGYDGRIAAYQVLIPKDISYNPDRSFGIVDREAYSMEKAIDLLFVKGEISEFQAEQQKKL